MMVFVPLVLGAQLTLVADQPPTLNVEQSCEAAAAAGVQGRTKQSCLDDENHAKAGLNDQWHKFTAAQRSRCTGLVNTGGPPSYVELLTCLEMAEQAKSVPAGAALRPPGTKDAE